MNEDKVNLEMEELIKKGWARERLVIDGMAVEGYWKHPLIENAGFDFESAKKMCRKMDREKEMEELGKWGVEG